MEKKDMNKVVIAIVAVALVIAIIGGSTFAYWQWVTATNQQTFVNVTVQDGISMVITPSTTQTQKLYPVTRANCDSAKIVGTATVEVTNGTGIEARPQFYLKVKILDKNGVNITDDQYNGKTYAEYINFAVAEGTDTTSTCATAKRFGTFTGENTVESDGSQTYTDWNDSPIITNLTDPDNEGSASSFPILPASETYAENAVNYSMTFKVDPYSNGTDNPVATHTYKYWAWIDSSYTSTTIGNTTNTNEDGTTFDRLQDAQIFVSWSEKSQVKQVTTS